MNLNNNDSLSTTHEQEHMNNEAGINSDTLWSALTGRQTHNVEHMSCSQCLCVNIWHQSELKSQRVTFKGIISMKWN